MKPSLPKRKPEGRSRILQLRLSFKDREWLLSYAEQQEVTIEYLAALMLEHMIAEIRDE